MGNASTRNAYSSSQQKVSSHSHGISKIEGLIVSTTPEPKVKQKRIREPDCHKKGGWVAIGTFVVTHPSEKVPILCNTRYSKFRVSCLSHRQRRTAAPFRHVIQRHNEYLSRRHRCMCVCSLAIMVGTSQGSL